ncbi:MAG: hypothetical protein JWP91_1781 [Fibrobacteres bacterium]|nr:hypothetical protein [Fibrobacterota bacterium]
MFSLLSPISLWLGAALAVPLMIHFLGRQRLRRQPFPSLLLVRERFSKSMHRHRLKNLLLLLIRTLLILCLLLALANPAMESRRASAKPDISIALIHNGIYGRLQPQGDAGEDPSGVQASLPATPNAQGTEALDLQWRRLRALDSLAGIRSQVLPVIEDGSGAQEVSERFGNYGGAVGRAIAALGSRPGTAQIHLPVFDWGELAALQADLSLALKEHPGLQFVLTDYGKAASRLSAFTGLKATPSPESPTIRLVARLSPEAANDAGGKTQVSLNGRLFQEVSPLGGRAEVTLPLGEGPRTVGKFALASGGFASPEFHFCFPEAGEWALAHAGSALASLPSLGRESYFRRIVHVASAKDIPWNGAVGGAGKADQGGMAKTGSRGASGGLRLVYLAAERGAQPDVYARAVEYVKRGGRLIIGVGRESDIPMLNRFLLQPLRMGRLGNLVETAGAGSASPAPVSIDREALARMGRLPVDPGTLGAVRKRFAFAPDSGVEIILRQGGVSEAVLAAREFHKGQVLLWTTDLDDLEWSDIGVSPLIPLLHQAFQETGAGDRAANLAVASDSIYTASSGQDADGMAAVPAAAGAGVSGNGTRTEVFDPEGRPFTKVRADGSRLRIGPFDRLGIHLIVTGRDTAAFAVNLASHGPAGGIRAAEGISEDPSATAWAEANEEAKAGFLKELKPFRGRLTVLSPGESAVVQASVRRLWPEFLLAALLLLFLEGLISATFSLRRSRT